MIQFKQTFTAAWLAEQAGIRPASTKPVVLVQIEGVSSPQDIIAPIFKVLGGTTFFVRILTETMNIASVATAKLGGQPDLPFAGRTLALFNIIGRYASSVFSTPWALKAGAGGFNCSDAKGLTNTIWLCQVLCGPSRGLIIWTVGAKKNIPSEVNDLTLTLWGAVNLGLNIWLITKPDYSGSDALKARAIMSPLGTQLLRFALVGPIVVSTQGISAVILEVIVLGTFIANGAITLGDV